MKHKIQKLTEDQRVRFPEFIEEWTKIGLSTDPADRPRAEAAIKWMYAQANLKEPRIVWTGSPLSSGLTRKIVTSEKFKKEIGDSVRDSVGASVRDSVGASVGDSVGDSVWASVGASVWASVGDSVRASVWASVRDSVRASVGDSVRDSVRDSVWAKYTEFSYEHLCYWSDFGAWYQYWTEAGIIPRQENADRYITYLQSAPFFTIFLEGLAIGCRRPSTCLTTVSGKLHSSETAALEWRDGYKLYFLSGVLFDEALWKKVTSGTMKFKEVMAIENIEQRMAALKEINADELLKGAEAELLDSSKRGNQLYLIKKLFSRDAYFLRYVCPSTDRVYISGIDPTVGSLKDADSAMSWKHGITKQQYTLLTNES